MMMIEDVVNRNDENSFISHLDRHDSTIIIMPWTKKEIYHCGRDIPLS